MKLGKTSILLNHLRFETDWNEVKLDEYNL